MISDSIITSQLLATAIAGYGDVACKHLRPF